MIQDFYKNYIFLDLLEKNKLFFYDKYEWPFQHIFITLNKWNFKSIKKKHFHYSLRSLEKITGKYSFLNLKLTKQPFYIYLDTSKYYKLLCSFFHIFEKYLYEENIFFNLNLWKYISTKTSNIIKIDNLILLSKKWKFLHEYDSLEIIYFFSEKNIMKTHLPIFLPYLSNI